ncbi:MAG: type II toxin-antitoxin system HicB family antitoxin [Planctomycetota bacterium]|nr:MAG: type II toxin-antitoxin system HicB family antitoxin [Planctomycetota bacterium]
MQFTVILTPDKEDGGFAAECPAIPGCISEGDTVEEALGNIKEAIEGCLESLAAHRQRLPNDGGIIVATVEADVPGRAKSKVKA